MKLLVLAQTPPPLHGQSLMVQALIAGLPAQGISVRHVNLRLSRDSTDIGRWRIGKIASIFAGALQTIATRFRHGCDTLYYVPAPGKRGAIYRDWLVMLLCRPFFRRLVLHWHATGLSEWLETKALPLERTLTRGLLGRADLSIVLAEALRADAEYLQSRRIVVVPNGTADPGSAPLPPREESGAPCEVLFLGLGSRAKGLFDTLEAVAFLHAHNPGSFRLTFAGDFATRAEKEEFGTRAAALGEAVRQTGFVDEKQKQALLAAADVLCFPTAYPHEGQPLVLIEALAFDLPIVTTRWRGIPGMLPGPHVYFVDPGRPDLIAEALTRAQHDGPPCGALRRQYLESFTLARHLEALASAFVALEAGN